ncbi:uncharacterized protein LOC120427087 isoform X2 [Culex pipiens pallens]|uniref:uncharacterized protein LOC120427086 isoform X2 n=1 Tax=Culex pipiens pallens TaxID=42434 RepID=UPI001952F774|nr:uncharacterized protein LOC120427086 isoform X2 [Culex pipiens pallens]XP_039447868.1 uncharacterized protein LOC120427087 isoform X2 [Culex pipiens pallens]
MVCSGSRNGSWRTRTSPAGYATAQLLDHQSRRTVVATPVIKDFPTDAELADLPGIFCVVMHDFRLDLLPTPEFVQVHKQMSNSVQGWSAGQGGRLGRASADVQH